jgi:hypothetical protein
MKNIVFWDMMSYGSYKNRRFGAEIINLMMEMIHSSEMAVLMRATWRHIPEDSNLLRDRRLSRISDKCY